MTGAPPTMPSVRGVPLATWDAKDPRLSASQQRALGDAVLADPAARILGLDQSLRPVVRAVLGTPPKVTEYAIQRNGDPVVPNLDSGRLHESWSDRVGRVEARR